MCTRYERFVCFGECIAQHLVRSEQSNSVVITLVSSSMEMCLLSGNVQFASSLVQGTTITH